MSDNPAVLDSGSLYVSQHLGLRPRPQILGKITRQSGYAIDAHITEG